MKSESRRGIWLFLLPAIVFIVVLFLYPFAYGLFLSFTTAEGAPSLANCSAAARPRPEVAPVTTTVRPRNEAVFFSIWRLRSTNSSDRSSRPTISARESPSIPSR